MSDLLLEWASYRLSGRRDDLPVEMLDGEQPVWVLADLATLGHIDLLPDGRWRTAPPVLAAISDDTGLAVGAILCGARTPKILMRFRDACSRAAATITETIQPKRPSVIMVTTRGGADLSAIASDAGLLCQRDAAFTILACLPTIQNWPRSPCPMVVGRVQDVKRFSSSRLAWVPSSLEAAAAAQRGFFRIHRDWDWINLLKQVSDRRRRSMRQPAGLPPRSAPRLCHGISLRADCGFLSRSTLQRQSHELWFSVQELCPRGIVKAAP